MKAPRLLERYLKNLVLRAEIGINRCLGREFIPASVEAMCIETSSACNLKCRFCAYEKKQSPRVSMTTTMFKECVEQALPLGYKEFHLTPCTGDVFMDKNVFEKFEFMEQHPEVRAYHFFTNLSVLDAEDIVRLMTLRKLSRITVSIYGHDEASFMALANSSAKIYRRLMDNLETMLECRAQWPFSVTIGFRSTLDAPRDTSSDLLKMIARYRAAGAGVHSSHGMYNNWGGYITDEDVKGLNIHVMKADGIYKSGPCVKLFDSFQITASGIVNGCSCRDVDTTLKIGDIREKGLREILSRDNPAYQEIIRRQERGDFHAICRDCDYYRSVYHQPSNYRREQTPTRTMADFLKATQVD